MNRLLLGKSHGCNGCQHSLKLLQKFCNVKEAELWLLKLLWCVNASVVAMEGIAKAVKVYYGGQTVTATVTAVDLLIIKIVLR